MENEENIAVQPDAPEEREAPLFANETAASEELYRQIVQKLLFYSPKAKAVWVIEGLYVAIMIGVMIAWRVAHPLALLLIAFILGWFAYKILVWPRKQAQKALRRIAETSSAPPAMQYAFYDDRMDLRNAANNAEGSLRYDSVSYCAETKDALLMVTKQKQTLFLSKSGFSGTDAEGFKEFMRQKAPNAKFRWK